MTNELLDEIDEVEMNIKQDLGIYDSNHPLIRELEKLKEFEEIGSPAANKRYRKLADIIITKYDASDKLFNYGAIKNDKNVDLTPTEKHKMITEETNRIVQSINEKRIYDSLARAEYENTAKPELVTKEERNKIRKQVQTALGFSNKNYSATKIYAETSDEVQKIGKFRELQEDKFKEGGTGSVDSDSSGSQGLNFNLSSKDIKFSLSFLLSLVKDRPIFSRNSVLDCGAGIGFRWARARGRGCRPGC
jgi:hypothetical protein